MRALTQEEKEHVGQTWRRKHFGGAAEATRVFEEQRHQQLTQERAQREPTTAVATQHRESVYTFEFGQFKKKTIREVIGLGEREARHKDYIPWLIKSGMHMRYPAFAAGLEAEGVWEDMTARAEELRPKLRQRALEKKADIDAAVQAGQVVHKDVVALRTLDAQIASHEELSGIPIWADAVPDSLVVARPAKRRLHRSKAEVLLSHCRYCGMQGHRTPTCRRLEKDAKDPLKSRPTGVVKLLERRRWRLVAHMKYTWLQNRTQEYEGKPVKRCRASVVRSGDELTRMTVQEFCQCLFADHLLFNLEGNPCTNPGCAAKPGKFSVGQPRVLGPWKVLTAVAKAVKSVGPHVAVYRCRQIRRITQQTYRTHRKYTKQTQQIHRKHSKYTKQTANTLDRKSVV